MDVVSLLNISGPLEQLKSSRTSTSPSNTDSGRTISSAALPTPSPDRVFASLEGETDIWHDEQSFLPLYIDTKGLAKSSLSTKPLNTRPWPCNQSRHSSVSSTYVPRSLSQLPNLFESQSSTAQSVESRCDRTETPCSFQSLRFRCRSQSTSGRSSDPSHTPVLSPLDVDRPFDSKTFQKAQIEITEMRRRGSNGSEVTNINSQHYSSTSQDRTWSASSPHNTNQQDLIKSGDSILSPGKTTLQISSEETLTKASSGMPSAAGGATESLALSPASIDPTNLDHDDQEAYCMFVKNCDTGSQLRKAISHLFGRNKACTLKIPKHVWVYYCRKHYQRVRYRNAKTYPLNQMELVKLQIERLGAWSDDNQKTGRGPFIKSWTISLRKREQNRLESSESGGNTTNGPLSGTAVPEWLIKQVGNGYSTEKMLEVADRLYAEIGKGQLKQIPEIEFLPDIVDEEDNASKVGRVRKPSALLKRKANEAAEQYIEGSNYQPSRTAYGKHDDPFNVDLSSPTLESKRARLSDASSVSWGRGSPLPPLASTVPFRDSSVDLSFRNSLPHPSIPPPNLPRLQPLGFGRDDASSRRGSHTTEYSMHPRRDSIHNYNSQYGLDSRSHSLEQPLLPSISSGFPADNEHRSMAPQQRYSLTSREQMPREDRLQPAYARSGSKHTMGYTARLGDYTAMGPASREAYTYEQPGYPGANQRPADERRNLNPWVPESTSSPRAHSAVHSNVGNSNYHHIHRPVQLPSLGPHGLPRSESENPSFWPRR